jgi:hypothetical protein
MSERERLARRLEEIALPGQAGDHERIVAYTLRYGSETMSGDAAFRRGHTFATEALAAGVSIFELARVMGASVRTIDRHYGHLARDSEQAIRARLNVKRHRSGVLVATGEEE